MMKAHFKKLGLPVLLAAAALTMQVSSSQAAESAFKIPAPKSVAAATSATTETVVLAGGCFWGVQAVFQHTLGVTSAVSGYAGGSKESAHYDMVGSGSTGHAESVKVTFDPRKISYGKILQIYFSVVHDPTQLNRQGPDTGTQYRSAIFYQNDDQKRIAADYIAQLDAAKVYPARIVTQLTPLQPTAFYPAEDYHQDFATLHPQQGYIARYDLPKIENFKQMYPADYRAAPVTVFRN